MSATPKVAVSRREGRTHRRGGGGRRHDGPRGSSTPTRRTPTGRRWRPPPRARRWPGPRSWCARAREEDVAAVLADRGRAAHAGRALGRRLGDPGRRACRSTAASCSTCARSTAILEIDEISMTVTAQAGRQRPAPRGRAERPRPDASPLPRLGRVGDGRRLHRGAWLGRALHALRQDRGPAAQPARGHAGHRPDRDGGGAAARGGPRADAAVRRVRGHARRDHAARRSSSCPMPAERRFAAVAFPSVGAGIHAIRRTLQAGHRPSVVRMYDEDATRLAFAPVVGEDLQRRLHRARLRGRDRGRGRGGAPDARDRGGGRRRAARSGARPALVGPALRLLPPAAPARAARDLGHARRGGHLLAGRGGLRGAPHGGARALCRRRARAADALLALVPVGHDDLRPLRRPRRRARTRSRCTTGSGRTG